MWAGRGVSILPRLRAGRHSEGNHVGVLSLKLTVLKWDETTASRLSPDPSAGGILLVPRAHHASGHEVRFPGSFSLRSCRDRFPFLP